MTDPLLEVEDLTIRYETDQGAVTAVSDANFTVESGKYFGLVGESGCGKSTIAKSIIGALDANGEVTSGTIKYRGSEIQHLSEKELNRRIRWKEISFIPQSSMDTLDPLDRISEQAVRIGKVHGMGEEKTMDRFRDLFEVVGLQPGRITDYPHQFSGGMKQRVIIALSLLLDPSLVIADEPTTALDVIMQDQIFNYLDDRERMGASMILITHDISLVFESCDHMAVMHGGQIAETATATEIYDSPRHPYTILLQKAFPDIRDPKRELAVIDGTPPQLFGEITQCTFAERCPWAAEECFQTAPPLEQVSSDDGRESKTHRAACIREAEVAKDRRREAMDQTTGGARDN
jgi:oligopeptide/dipeptide ABC transporter ATP-binding protein